MTEAIHGMPPGAPPAADELNALAAKYLNLWVEHWAASMAAPETADLVARLFTPPGAASGGILDAFAGWQGAGLKPSSVRTAPDAGDVRVDELESRIAALERRVAAAESKPVTADAPRKPVRRPRKV